MKRVMMIDDTVMLMNDDDDELMMMKCDIRDRWAAVTKSISGVKTYDDDDDVQSFNVHLKAG